VGLGQETVVLIIFLLFTPWIKSKTLLATDKLPNAFELFQKPKSFFYVLFP
jgi:hypothetical protein